MRTLLVLLALAAAVKAADPTYRLVPGAELRFRGKGESFGRTIESTCRVWVVRANADRTVRLVLCLEIAGSDRPLWSWCDMAPDGSYAANGTTPHADPGDVLPLLPRAGQATRRLGPLTLHYSETGPEAFAFVIESGESKVYGVQESFRATLADGLPATVEKTLRRGGAVSAKGLMALEDHLQHEAEWRESFAAETDAFFEAVRRYQETCDRTLLDAMLERATIEGIRADLRARLGEHDERAAFEKERREKQGKIVGRPSPEWTTEDFDGKRHALADYRGKVVVLDFWFRGCGWCVRSMPEVKDIAARFAKRPVAVLGMNVDRRDEDARFVIEALALPYPNLKARTVRDHYAVMGYPTVVVIDPKGVVRRIHHGAWPALGTELEALIEELLGEAE